MEFSEPHNSDLRGFVVHYKTRKAAYKSYAWKATYKYANMVLLDATSKERVCWPPSGVPLLKFAT